MFNDIRWLLEGMSSGLWHFWNLSVKICFEQCIYTTAGVGHFESAVVSIHEEWQVTVVNRWQGSECIWFSNKLRLQRPIHGPSQHKSYCLWVCKVNDNLFVYNQFVYYAAKLDPHGYNDILKCYLRNFWFFFCKGSRICLSFCVINYYTFLQVHICYSFSSVNQAIYVIFCAKTLSIYCLCTYCCPFLLRMSMTEGVFIKRVALNAEYNKNKIEKSACHFGSSNSSNIQFKYYWMLFLSST